MSSNEITKDSSHPQESKTSKLMVSDVLGLKNMIQNSQSIFRLPYFAARGDKPQKPVIYHNISRLENGTFEYSYQDHDMDTSKVQNCDYSLEEQYESALIGGVMCPCCGAEYVQIRTAVILKPNMKTDVHPAINELISSINEDLTKQYNTHIEKLVEQRIKDYVEVFKHGMAENRITKVEIQEMIDEYPGDDDSTETSKILKDYGRLLSAEMLELLKRMLKD